MTDEELKELVKGSDTEKSKFMTLLNLLVK